MKKLVLFYFLQWIRRHRALINKPFNTAQMYLYSVIYKQMFTFGNFVRPQQSQVTLCQWIIPISTIVPVNWLLTMWRWNTKVITVAINFIPLSTYIRDRWRLVCVWTILAHYVHMPMIAFVLIVIIPNIFISHFFNSTERNILCNLWE